MKRNLRNTAKIAVLCLSLFVLFSCSSNSDSQKKVTVIIEDKVAAENALSVSGEIDIPKEASAGECFRQLCNKNDFEIAGVDEGYITSVNKIASDGDYAWMFYVNGELADKGVGEIVPDDGDEITLVYVNWKELFDEE